MESEIRPRKTTMKTIQFNGIAYTCPFRDMMPPLSVEERTELTADISANGVLYEIIVTDTNEIIDGHHRLAIADELGLADVPIKVIAGLTPDRRRSRAADLNLHRRHVSREQKREIIARLLRDDPARSNRDIANTANVNHQTVAKIRTGMEGTGQIGQLPATRGRDGKTRKRRQPAVDGQHDRDQADSPPPATADQPIGKKNRLRAILRHEIDVIERLLNDAKSLCLTQVAERGPAAILEFARRMHEFASQIEYMVREAERS